MTSPSIRGVIFDLGSTLIDFHADFEQIFPESLEAIADHFLAHSVSLNRTEFIRQFGLALRGYQHQRDNDLIERTTYAILCEVLQELLEPLPDEALLRDGLAAMYAVSEAHWVTKPATHTVLTQLAGAGYRLGLLSNAGDEANVHRLIDNAAIRDFFDPILISAAVGIRKPDPRLFRQILEQWALPAQAVMMVGDLLQADILGAQRTGMHTIWLRAGSMRHKAAGELQPDFVTSDLEQVPALIERIGEKG